MATAIRTPRVNNNDDTVRLTRFHCAPGTLVRRGDLIAEVETDKASFTVEVDQDGYLLGFVQPLGEMVTVGSVLAWLGETADESLPAADTAPLATAGVDGGHTAAEPTLKAALLLRRYGLAADDVPASGDRLSAGDVLAYVQLRNLQEVGAAPSVTARPTMPSSDLIAGARVPLSVGERGMLRTVQWHRDVAVPGYVEIEYETGAWEGYAAAFRARHQLLMDPLLPLMAHRFVRLAAEQRKLNATIVNDERHEYASLNLGFTMQSGSRLILLCIRDAGALDERALVDTLGELTRLGLKGKLTAEQTSGVTLSFSSMARWQVTRHMPILPPLTSMMIAHAHGGGPRATLGASYDHRVLTGGEVAIALRALAMPPQGETAA